MAKGKSGGNYVGSEANVGVTRKSPAEEIEERRKKASETISGATNKAELKAAMESLGLQGQTSFIDGVKSFESAQRIASAVADMNAVWGVEGIGDVTTKGNFASGTIGYRQAGDPTIHLNPKEYNNIGALQVSNGLESVLNFTYKNQSPESVVKHEYAHVLEDRLVDMHSDSLRRIEAQRASAQATIDRLTQGHQKEWQEASKYLDRASSVRTVQARFKNVVKARDVMRRALNPSDFNALMSAINSRTAAQNARTMHIRSVQESAIQRIFGSVGMTSPTHVASEMTGNPRAYARKNWHEAHAEAIADYMTNGRNASPVSIAYAQAFAREIGVTLP